MAYKKDNGNAYIGQQVYYWADSGGQRSICPRPAIVTGIFVDLVTLAVFGGREGFEVKHNIRYSSDQNDPYSDTWTHMTEESRFTWDNPMYMKED